MSEIPCQQNAALDGQIKAFAEVLKTQAHTLGKKQHGLDEKEFYNSGLFRGAIERIRGQFSATMGAKRDFVQRILNYLEDQQLISGWEVSGDSNRHDYAVTLNSGRVAVIELKGCLDGNNTNIFDRPAHANEFVIWSLCTNQGADPRHNVWSGIHTRLSAEIITRRQVVDGLIVWDMVCSTIGRPCPKILGDGNTDRLTDVGPFRVPPPCIYLFPGTVPSVRNNPAPQAHSLQGVELLNALHTCFKGKDTELNEVTFAVEHVGAETARQTTIKRAGIVQRQSAFTPIHRS